MINWNIQSSSQQKMNLQEKSNKEAICCGGNAADYSRQHKIEFVTDSNAFTCMQCGLIFDSYSYADEQIKPMQWATLGPDMTFKTYLSESFPNLSVVESVQWNFDTFERICDRFHVPKNAEIYAKDLLKSDVYVEKRNGRTRRDLTLQCVALYTSCLKEQIGKSAKLLCLCFDIDEKDFWSVYNTFGYKQRKISPRELLLSISEELKSIDSELSYKNFEQIALTADKLAEGLCHSPNVILASCVFLYLNEIRKRKISIRAVAHICGVSCTSLTTLKNALKTQNIFQQDAQ